MPQKNTVMTTKELADYIKVHEKTVIKQAQEGKLPGVKIGNQWRFHLSAIDDYLQKDVVKMPDDDLNEIIKTAENIIPISRLTDSALIALDMDVSSREQLFEEVGVLAQSAQILTEDKKFIGLLEEREQLISTAVGEGIAIPHPRHPEPGMFKRPHIIIVRTARDLDFDAPDGKKVKLFFIICATNEFVHLRLLAKISKLLHEDELREQIICAKTKQDLMKALLEFDRKRIFPIVDRKE